MTKRFLNLPLMVRYILFLVILVLWGQLAPKKELGPILLAAIVVYAAGAACFYPEIRRFFSSYRQLLKNEEHKDIALCNFLVSLAPGNIAFIIGRAIVFLRLDRMEEAKADADLAVEIAPNSWWAWNTRATIAAHLLEYESAGSDADKAVELAPSNSEALTMRAHIRLSKNDSQGCLEDCIKVERLGKTDAQVRMMMIHCHFMSGDVRAAEAVARKIGDKIAPDSLDAYSLACLERHQNKYDEVLSICAQVSDKKYYAYWFLDIQANAYRFLNEGELAMQSIARAIALKPKMTNAYLERAQLLVEAGFLDQALADCERKDIPRSKWESRSTEAYVRFHRGEFAKMLECTQHATTVSPRSSYAHSLHSLALAGLGRLDEALEEGTTASQLDRLGQIAWYALANAYLKKDQFDQAIKSLDSGLAADPNYRYSYQLRAEAHRRAGHDGEAEKDQSKFDQLQAHYTANFHCD